MDNARKKEFVFHAWGHPNITSRHKTTWQITTEDHLTLNGDCIIGIRSNMGPSENIIYEMKVKLRFL
ncbi:MAG: DUF371 domain-containing protein [Candidatus Kariarchaeaceae archaeon]|jgi:hypothetical protein